MRQIDLDNLRQSYEELIKRNNMLIQLKEVLRTLEGNQVVQTYNKIKMILEQEQILDEKAIITKVFDDDVLKNINSDIYVYMGAFEKNGSYNLRFDYLLYKNLINTFDERYVRPNSCLDFEGVNIVIKFNNCNLSEDDFDNLQVFYLKELLKGKTVGQILEELEVNKEEFNIAIIKRPKARSLKIRGLGKENY